MTFKINRIYYLFTGTFLKILLFELLFALILFLIAWFTVYEIPVELIIGIPCLLVIVDLFYLLSFPSKFTVKSGDIRIHLWLEKLAAPKWGDLRIGRVRVRHRPVYVTMHHIAQMEVIRLGCANARSIGTLRLFGKVYAQDHFGTPVLDIFIPRHIELHGVKDLDAVIKELRSAYPRAEVTDTNRRRK